MYYSADNPAAVSDQSRLAYTLYQSIWSSLDWIFPPRCGGCGKSGSRWCASCQRDTVLIRPPFCPICGAISVERGGCRTCRRHPPEFSALRSWGVFTGPLQNALHRLKYHRDIALGEVLSRNMVDCLLEQQWSLDLVVPVPLGVARLAERGYNQAALLAKPVALACGLGYSTKLLQEDA